MGNEAKIPLQLQEEARTDPKGLFDKLWKKDGKWKSLMMEQKSENVETDDSEDLREWLFADEVLNTFCQRNKQRCKAMLKGLKKGNHWRWHPDMPRNRHALQYHALKMSTSKRASSHSTTNTQRSSTEETPAAKKQRTAEAEESTAAPAAKKDGESVAETTAGSKTAEKPKSAAQLKKEQVIKQQKAEDQKEKKKTDPLERAKGVLAAAGKWITELKETEMQMKSRKLIAGIPPGMLQEYVATVKKHLLEIQDARSLIESTPKTDVKHFTKKVSGERLDQAEKEIGLAKLTCKAWKGTIHVYSKLLAENKTPKTQTPKTDGKGSTKKD